MADRVHPTDSPPAADAKPQEAMKPNAAAGGDPEAPASPKFEAETFPARPKSGTYVIQIPKDQIYRVPPPENAHLFENYSRRGDRRRRNSPCCRCLIWTLFTLLALVVALAVAFAILYFVFQPKVPSYSLDKIAIKGLNLSVAAGPSLSPEFDVTVRADNPNKKIGLYYDDGSDIIVYYSGVSLCHGSWPVFYQGHQNVTVFDTKLRGSGIRLSGSLQRELVDQQRKAQVPLEIDVRVPVRVKFGAVTSWTITVKVRCDVVVDKLTANSKIVSKTCRTKVDI